MNDNQETSFHSAKAVADYYKKKEIEAKRKEAEANKANQLASEQIALLKESNKLAEQTLAKSKLKTEQESAIHKTSRTDLVEIKPNFFGLGLNINELWRRFKKWHSK